VTDTGRGKVHRHRSAEPTKTDDQDRRLEQSHLPSGIDLRQHDLSTVAKQLFVLHIQTYDPRLQVSGALRERQGASDQGARAQATRGKPEWSCWSHTSR